MPRTPPAFKQTDVTKAVKAVLAAGEKIASTQVSKDGRIVIIHKQDGAAEPRDADAVFEGWRAGRDARSS